jgi:putative DNA methylase
LHCVIGRNQSRQGGGTAEALSYNALVQSWPEISRLAREGGNAGAKQGSLFEEPEA